MNDPNLKDKLSSGEISQSKFHKHNLDLRVRLKIYLIHNLNYKVLVHFTFFHQNSESKTVPFRKIIFIRNIAQPQFTEMYLI